MKANRSIACLLLAALPTLAKIPTLVACGDQDLLTVGQQDARFQRGDGLFELKKRDHALFRLPAGSSAPQEARLASHSSSHLMV